MNQPRAIAWRSVGRTQKGAERTLNQDAFLNRPEMGIWAVADGMGGHEAGDAASVSVVTSLAMLGRDTSLADLIHDSKARLRAVNEQLYGKTNKSKIGSGSTVVALLTQGTHVAILWAGDSRAYRQRDGTLEQLTVDHSQVQQLVGEGLLSAEEAEDHPRSNVITRAVGMMADIDFDTQILEAAVGDAFLLCSDGLYREVGADDIAKCLALENSENACDELIKRAADGDGNEDDATVVVVRAVAAGSTENIAATDPQSTAESDKTAIDMTQVIT